jgi:hypothetical protein
VRQKFSADWGPGGWSPIRQWVLGVGFALLGGVHNLYGFLIGLPQKLSGGKIGLSRSDPFSQLSNIFPVRPLPSSNG